LTLDPSACPQAYPPPCAGGFFIAGKENCHGEENQAQTTPQAGLLNGGLHFPFTGSGCLTMARKAKSTNSSSKPDMPFRDALRTELAALALDNSRGLRQIAARLIELAEGGDFRAIKEIADRIDDKAERPAAGDEGAAPVIVQRIELVAPGHDD
jgi:hypothetical protein